MTKRKSYYTTQEIAELLSVNVMTIYRYIKAKRLKAHKIGKEFRIERSQMKPAGNDSKWSPVTSLVLNVTPQAGAEMIIANVKLRPPRETDRATQEPIKQRIIAHKTTKPPVIDGHSNDALNPIRDFSLISNRIFRTKNK